MPLPVASRASSSRSSRCREPGLRRSAAAFAVRRPRGGRRAAGASRSARRAPCRRSPRAGAPALVRHVRRWSGGRSRPARRSSRRGARRRRAARGRCGPARPCADARSGSVLGHARCRVASRRRSPAALPARVAERPRRRRSEQSSSTSGRPGPRPRTARSQRRGTAGGQQRRPAAPVRPARAEMPVGRRQLGSDAGRGQHVDGGQREHTERRSMHRGPAEGACARAAERERREQVGQAEQARSPRRRRSTP